MSEPICRHCGHPEHDVEGWPCCYASVVDEGLEASMPPEFTDEALERFAAEHDDTAEGGAA